MKANPKYDSLTLPSKLVVTQPFPFGATKSSLEFLRTGSLCLTAIAGTFLAVCVVIVVVALRNFENPFEIFRVEYILTAHKMASRGEKMRNGINESDSL